MADLRLSFAMTPYDRMQPLINGEVKPDGITLDFVGMPGGYARVFYDQIKFQRYDVSEMSFCSSLRMFPARWPYRMLPMFHNRNFSYTMIHIHRKSGIRQDHPEDLKGKRFGMWDYQQSLGLWVRGILQMEFGVRPEDMTWYQESGEHYSHSGASTDAGVPLPKTVKLHHTDTDLATMFAKGELDACASLGLKVEKVVFSVSDRAHAAVPENPDVITLFSDPHREAIRFYKKTGICPPHHTTVIRESIVKEHPWVATSLMEAFEESKRIAIERLHRAPPTLMVFGHFYLKETDAIFGADPFVYGIKANARIIDMAQTFALEQGLVERKQPLDEIFPQEAIYREE